MSGIRRCHALRKQKRAAVFHNLETLRETICDVWQVGDWKQKKIIVLTIEAACSESMTIKTSDSEVLAAPQSQSDIAKAVGK